MAVFEVSVIVSAVIILATVYIKWKHSYWKRRNVPQLSPSFIFGNAENPITQKYFIGEWLRNLYTQFKERGAAHAGVYVFTTPRYVPIQPEVIKNVMNRDFQYFSERGSYYNEEDDPLSAHLFKIGGQRWKNLRVILSPTFTSGKMKMMFETLVECTHPMETAMSNHCVNNQSVDIKEMVARFSTDVIGSCAFGLECNSFKSDDAALRTHGRKILAPKSKADTLKILFATSNSNWARRFGIAFLPRESTSFFFNVVKDTVKYRRENNVHRKDMLQIMMDLQKSEGIHIQQSLTIEEIAANSLVFFIGGFETSSTTMQFCLYELASNVDIQKKAREEINSVLKKHGGKITYDGIMDMKYMTQVIDETLRKYPPVVMVKRQCVKDYIEPITGVTIETGTNVIIPIWPLHMDPQYFADPEKFDPERFSEENKHTITPYTYMPFGEGPRICIGMRFGLMQVKVGLTSLLSNFSFTVNSKTLHIPFEWDTYSGLLATKRPIWLNAEKVS